MFNLMHQIWTYLKYHFYDYHRNTKYINNLVKTPNLDMTEVWGKTKEVVDNDSGLYKSVSQYMAGNCWLNAKLSQFYEFDELSDIDKMIYNGINETVKKVTPLSYPITLFHGFEEFTNYKENRWVIGRNINIPGFLSKTPSFHVAGLFAHGVSYFNRKYLIVEYPIGSKHIGLEIRPKHTEEYEYLTRSNENLLLVKKIRRLGFFYMSTYYVCKSLDY